MPKDTTRWCSARTRTATRKSQVCCPASSSDPSPPIHCILVNLQGSPKYWHSFLVYASILPNINRFSKLFHCQNQEKICNNITPHLKCVATLPCEMSSVLKVTIDNKTTSVTTHFKKLTTGNNVFIVSVIV